MKDWNHVAVSPYTTILQTMEVIDRSSLQFSVVTDEEGRLLGTVTDGDIRRGLLNGLPLSTTINLVMNQKPTYAYAYEYQVYKCKLLEVKGVQQLPIVDQDKKIQHILFSKEETHIEPKDNMVILMAGGLGTRLKPLTDNLPKPMLRVGTKPILETIIEGFKQHGFTNFAFSVNYKKELIKSYFQNGEHLGVSISYIDEHERLGTAGALSLLPTRPNKPFIVMNGDLLTKINYNQLLEFHNDTCSDATMCVREYEYQIPYGVIQTENHRLQSIEEKPMHRSFVNAGIYVLNPDVLNYVPHKTFFDMPELFKIAMEQNHNVSAFPLREYWMDIGQVHDYDKANQDFLSIFQN
ncbi:nucleotidyltransferase family protein [Metabacillus sp. FJAT-52054]|uniref:Nucleotidyltransferase family protein n=1 Tax=Metabacillus sediminis TaxID=3117746 RepID=A0ABZ2NFI6_9BACI